MVRHLLLVALMVSIGGAAAADSLILAGKVMDQAGQPVAGADVWVRNPRAEDWPVGKSDAQGSFRLEVEGSEREYWGVLAVAPGLAVGQGRYNATEPGPILIKLEPETHLRGVVLDQDGEPVAGADVILRALRQPGADIRGVVFLGDDGPVRAQSGADGSFLLGHVPRETEVDILVVAEGFAQWIQWSDPDRKPLLAGAEEPYEIRLQPAAIVSGVVTRDGQPVAGMGVWAQGIHPTEGWGETTADAEGRYRLEHLPAGAYNICIDDTEDFVAPAHENVTVAPGEELAGCDFTLTLGGIIQGRIVDAETGEGIPQARAAGYGPSRPQSGAACFGTEADENGEYRLRVAPGLNYIYYQGGIEDYPHSEDADYEIEVGEGETVRGPDLKLQRAEPFEIVVTDPDGEPVPGAKVTLSIDHFPYRRETDEDGKCAVRGLAPQHPFVVIVQHAERELVGAALVAPEQLGEPVRIVLTQGAAVAFRLVDPQFEPVADVEVSALVEMPDDHGPWTSGVTHLATAETDADGQVRLGNLPADAAIRFSINQRAAQPIDWPEVGPMMPGEVHELDDVVVDLSRMPVSGVVLTEGLEPVRGASVRASGREGGLAYTDEEGSFTLEDLLPSDSVLILAASADGKLFGAEELVPEWEFEPGIILHNPIRVSGQLIDEAGDPVANRKVGISCRFYRTEPLPVWADVVTDEDGWFTAERLVPGIEYDLIVWAPGMYAQQGRTHMQFIPEPDVDHDVGTITVSKAEMVE